MEIWKTIPGFNGRYEVSNLGNVRSLNYRNNGTIKVLKQQSVRHGYKRIGIGPKNCRKYYSVHGLVAWIFLGYDFGDKFLQIDHINEDKTDNRLENLQLITPRENTVKSRRKKSGLPTGVTKINTISNPYQSRIYHNGKTINLGSFPTPEEASKAYQDYLNKIIDSPK